MPTLPSPDLIPGKLNKPGKPYDADELTRWFAEEYEAIRGRLVTGSFTIRCFDMEISPDGRIVIDSSGNLHIGDIEQAGGGASSTFIGGWQPGQFMVGRFVFDDVNFASGWALTNAAGSAVEGTLGSLSLERITCFGDGILFDRNTSGSVRRFIDIDTENVGEVTDGLAVWTDASKTAYGPLILSELEFGEAGAEGRRAIFWDINNAEIEAVFDKLQMAGLGVRFAQNQPAISAANVISAGWAFNGDFGMYVNSSGSKAFLAFRRGSAIHAIELPVIA